MGIKHFCEACGVEVTQSNDLRPIGKVVGKGALRGRLAGVSGRMIFEVITGRGDTWNAGDYCRYCVIDAVRSVDDRPRAA